MQSQGPASLIKDVEFGPSDHSSALQLLSLGKPRTLMLQQQPPLKQEGHEPQRQEITSSIATTTARESELQLRHDSPPTTHGRHRKKRRMLEAQAAASTMLEDDQIMAATNNTSSTSDSKADETNTSHTEVGKTLNDFRTVAIVAEKDPAPNPSSSLSSPEKFAEQMVNHDKESNEFKNSEGKIKNETAEDSEDLPAEQNESPTHERSKASNKRTGSRRHAALPMNGHKEHATKEDTKSKKSQSVHKIKKSGRGKPKQSSLEIATAVNNYVDTPTDKDILLGRRGFNKHPGNVVYRETVRKFKPEIEFKARAEVAGEIIKHINDVIGGRFLKFYSEERWEIIPYDDVMTKVSKAIVELRDPVGKKPSKNIESVSVLESPKEGETQGRPKRKATLSRKVNNFMNEQAASIAPKKKKAKLPGSQNKTQEDSNPIKKRIVEEEVEKEVEQTYEEYIYKDDPNPYYVEESAHIYHNPPFPSKKTNGVPIEELRSVPPPPPLPDFPDTGSCRWSFNENDRVLIADFLGNKNGAEPTITLEDSKFLFEMQERTDITVISRGLLNFSKIDSNMWSLEYLKKCVGREFYHKFRRFDRVVDKNGMETYTEKDNLFSMRFQDYVDYCEKRELYIKERKDDSSTSDAVEEEPTFTFEDHLGEIHTVGVRTSALYMIDLDIKRLTPLLYKNFLDSFELPAVLPGGSHCMMNSVTPDARPFMGPNLYITPPASFTHFHQDGHGTVDSGHLCISGFNEVVMLRRLTERHKKHALWILSGKQSNGFHFDGLYSMPHGDLLGKKPPWPNTDMIEECKKMGYCPSIFTLEPGDCVHINKGRLHAFRKMSTSKLPESDCHAGHRRNIIESKGIAGEEKLCVSVAWDWMYRGITSAGINREVSTVLEGSALNEQNGVTSLAIPELSLLQMAKCVPARSLTSKKGISFLGALESKEKKVNVYESTKEDICRGMYPGLCVVVGKHIRALNVKESKSDEKGKRLSIATIPDTQENPQTCPLDPYGDSDFACKICRKELSNVYFHCDGCEKLLSKDFNICRGCYLEKKFQIKVQMHPSNPKRHATLNHMGDNKHSRQKRCPCKNGPACNYCGFCLGCSCRCHTWFTMRTRLCNAEDEEKLLNTVKCTAIPETISDSATAEGFQANVLEIEESTKTLCDRLKNAGDMELLNEEKKDEDVTKEENNENIRIDNMDEVCEKMITHQDPIKDIKGIGVVDENKQVETIERKAFSEEEIEDKDEDVFML